MKDLKSLLSGYFKLLDTKDNKRKSVAEAIEKISKIQIQTSSISIRRDVVFLTASSVEKNEIYFHKSEILESLKQENPPVAVKDII